MDSGHELSPDSSQLEWVRTSEIKEEKPELGQLVYQPPPGVMNAPRLQLVQTVKLRHGGVQVGRLSSWNVDVIILRHTDKLIQHLLVSAQLWWLRGVFPSNFQNKEELIPDVRLSAALKALHVTSGFAIESHQWAESSEAVKKLIKTFPQENTKT